MVYQETNDSHEFQSPFQTYLCLETLNEFCVYLKVLGFKPRKLISDEALYQVIFLYSSLLILLLLFLFHSLVVHVTSLNGV